MVCCFLCVCSLNEEKYNTLSLLAGFLAHNSSIHLSFIAFTDNCSVLSELCATLSRLSVRNEFCQEIVDLGGLNFMVSLLADSIDHPVSNIESTWGTENNAADLIFQILALSEP